MLESRFQSNLVKKLKRLFPGCIVVKNDSSYLQGFPDLTIYYRDKWATLECKNSADAKRQPNQKYYIDKMNEMSFSSFICPESEEKVLYDLQRTFQI